MKVAIAIASLLSLVTVADAIAQAKPLTYADIVKEARRYEKLEGGERTVSGKVLFQQVQLDLKPFTGGSKDFYVKKSDEIGFICLTSAPGFKGGLITAQVVKHEEGAEGSHFYTLKSCGSAK
jgi:hypothetical protein